MLPSSVRRVVAAGQQHAASSSAVAAAVRAAVTTTTTTTTTTATCTAVSPPLFARGHQRRYSSSKPSRSDNGGSDDMTGQSVTSARGQSKASGDKRKRKAAADRDATKKLPSVPNTHHMVGEALGLSSFFSLHRPISITQTMPRTVTDEQFASIFAPRTRGSKVSDAMSTISNTIDQLEGPMATMTLDGQQHQDGHHSGGVHRIEMRNPDGSDSAISIQVDAMSGDFLPFHPPPLPQPQSQVQNKSASAADAAADAAATPQHRSYKAMFTIEENTEPDGQIRIVAHSPQIVHDEQHQPRSFVERLARRQLRLNESQAGRRDMHAISVKRQRKLRMKKKKYKKLMRRTRNLRRKLDRN